MLILQDAFLIAKEFLDATIAEQRAIKVDRSVPQSDAEIVILSCRETDDCWLFGFDSREFGEGKQTTKSIIGTGPIVVPKSGEPPRFATVWEFRDVEYP